MSIIIAGLARCYAQKCDETGVYDAYCALVEHHGDNHEYRPGPWWDEKLDKEKNVGISARCASKYGELQCQLEEGHDDFHRNVDVDFVWSDPDEADLVNHPPHYRADTPYETVKVAEAWGLEKDAYLFNVLKYISRAGHKDGEDLSTALKKAQWFLNRRIENADREA